MPMSFEKTKNCCSRCLQESSKLYSFSFTDEEDEIPITKMICWSCDFDLANGQGEIHDDAGDIHLRREEEEYEYDPINNDRPSWME